MILYKEASVRERKKRYFDQNSTQSEQNSFTIPGLILTAVICGLMLIAFSSTSPAQTNGEWPAFHGTDRTNKSAETGLLKTWPAEGPKLEWTASGLGVGYSSISIADGMIFTAGESGAQSTIFAYDLDGKLLWQTDNGVSYTTELSWAKTYTGSRATPTYDKGVIYHLAESGRLAAIEAKTGKELWSKELRQEYDAELPMYGYAESVLIDGDRLYCNPVGKKAFMVCLDKSDGSLIWANTDIQGSEGYSSGIIAEFGGFRQIINYSGFGIYGIDSKTGRLLWTQEIKSKHSLNSTDAIYHDGYVLASTGYGAGTMLIKLTASNGNISPEVVWKNELMDNHHGGVILHEGHVYGAGHEARGWFCLDFMTGKEVWKARGKGSLTFADNKLYILEEKGGVRLVEATPVSFKERGSFETPEGGKGMYWAHPVVCGGRLYVRHTDKLFAYNIKGN